MSANELAHEVRGYGGVDSAPSRYDDEIGSTEDTLAHGRIDDQSARGTERAVLDGADRIAIPTGPHLRPWKAEHFRRDAELERAKAIICQDDDKRSGGLGNGQPWHEIIDGQGNTIGAILRK